MRTYRDATKRLRGSIDPKPIAARLAAHLRLRPLGADWYRRQATAVLRGPSPSIAHEHNYVLPTRPHFNKIRLAG